MARIAYRIKRVVRFLLPTACCLLPAVFLASCSTNLNRNVAATNPPIVRVRLLTSQDAVTVIASEPPVYRTESDPTPRVLGLPKGAPIVIKLNSSGWQVGGTTLGSGKLTIQPTVEGSVAVQSSTPGPGGAAAADKARPYRGLYKFVPVGGGKFDLVNEVDIDGYLAGVLPRELLRTWHEETYRAMSIACRTYVLYEKAFAAGRYWDVYADERSQVYGGMVDETDKSREAVNHTAGVVLAWAPEGQEPRIFKAYFSSCCGGITQSASDAFGESPIEPLSDQNNQAICNASPKFNWGPVVIGKEELTRRVKAWGAYKKRAERDIGPIKSVEVQALNSWGRPTRFTITDARNRYSLMAEEFRSACNWDANNATVKEKTGVNQPPVLFSSFVKVITDSESIRFVEGHGLGHGVGLCQWCSQRRAEEGMRHEDIVLAAYPHAKLVRAY
jgi:stage II sporulation protein D